MDVRDAESGRPVKRFKHQSYNETLKDVHLPSALNQAKFDNEIPDGSSHFHEALDHWRQLNLSPAFLVFANKADGLSASMPLLLHHWKDILNLWATAVEESDYEGLIALADLLQKLAHDLRTTILPVYLDLLSRLYSYLPRKIPAPTLTALLSALSALFKYLLIPSADAGLLDQSWSSLRDVLPKCNPEVQRAVAEVWGATLRRLKSAVRERAVELIAEDVDGLEDACAWMVVFACESVSQTLHTATASIVTPLLKHHLACAEPEKTYTLLRRLLTALIHHCKGPEQFSAVADALLDQVAALVQGLVDEKDHEPLRRMLEVLAVVCSVRQGSRLSQKQISIILSHVAAIPLTESLQASLLKLTVAALIAGELSLSLGPGRKVVEQSLQHPPFALQLYGSLAELQWGGWKLIALPNLLKAAPDLLHKEPRRTAELLATLYKKGMLGEVDAGFKVKFGEWARAKLSSWQKSEEQVFELASILALSGMIENMTELLVRLIEDTLAVQDPVADYEASYTNSSWVLASCMEALSKCRHSEWHQRVDLTLWTENVVQRWGWSEGVLGGMVSLIDAGCAPFNCV
ncbi:hypothetical protein GLOTRDRAFT_42472 [Gloeophyllum trabeum ATCC 11539]|uniref:Uncharacterized protein n=1 Tax=Gloeophyllum trabeum (strain ATCC 11539 / FP-39264 / Madison 617) TaxID=670483 RepID=S7Q750_GLOTA|nr:uncharacterized protein GLOTRDRAFT_42472 [Gloeophyllum trabeum ATCC 11539]EPQ55347.1 hypothetical protein GLOTRDRAFT_42472 [Gloeophyllum trabeum ATCC 11539]